MTRVGEALVSVAFSRVENHARWAIAALMENGTQTRHIWTFACTLRWTLLLYPPVNEHTQRSTCIHTRSVHICNHFVSQDVGAVNVFTQFEMFSYKKIYIKKNECMQCFLTMDWLETVWSVVLFHVLSLYLSIIIFMVLILLVLFLSSLA